MEIRTIEALKWLKIFSKQTKAKHNRVNILWVLLWWYHQCRSDKAICLFFVVSVMWWRGVWSQLLAHSPLLDNFLVFMPERITEHLSWRSTWSTPEMWWQDRCMVKIPLVKCMWGVQPIDMNATTKWDGVAFWGELNLTLCGVCGDMDSFR